MDKEKRQTGKNKEKQRSPKELSAEQRVRLCEEQDVVDTMISIYCKGKKHERGTDPLCPSCTSLRHYTEERTASCPFLKRDAKPFCQFCPVHCYSEDKRKEIIDVMRYAGPRMIWHKPIVALKHLAAVRAHKKKL